MCHTVPVWRAEDNCGSHFSAIIVWLKSSSLVANAFECWAVLPAPMFPFLLLIFYATFFIQIFKNLFFFHFRMCSVHVCVLMFECMWTLGVHIDVCPCGGLMWMSEMIFHYSSLYLAKENPSIKLRAPPDFLGDSLCSESGRTGWQPHLPNIQEGAGHLNLLLQLIPPVLECWALDPALRCLVYKAFIFLHVKPVHLALSPPTYICIFYIVVNVRLCPVCVMMLLLVSRALFPGLNSSVFTLAWGECSVVFSVSMFPLQSQSRGIVCKQQ